MKVCARRLVVAAAASTAGATTASTTTVAASSAPAEENERSFLRNIIPFRVSGSGPTSTLLQHAFLQQDRLIVRFLGALEQVPLPALPRMLLAEGMQRLLEGQCPQRDLRAIFEEAEMECRKLLLEFNSDHDTHGRTREMKMAVQHDPLRRILAYELRGACGYYARLLSLSPFPESEAAVSLRTLIASDLRTDDFLVDLLLKFDRHPRDPATGAHLEPMPTAMSECVKECLLLERDAFGVFRFDARGDNRHLVHSLLLSNITKTPDTFSTVLDPVMQGSGNFVIKSEPVFDGRWMRHEVSCGVEDHRIDADLPVLETVIAEDAITGREQSLIVRYGEPVCFERHKETTKEGKGNYGYAEVFELAVEDRNRTWFERYFLDR